MPFALLSALESWRSVPLSLGCRDDGGMMEAPTMTAGSGGSSGHERWRQQQRGHERWRKQQRRYHQQHVVRRPRREAARAVWPARTVAVARAVSAAQAAPLSIRTAARPPAGLGRLRQADGSRAATPPDTGNTCHRIRQGGALPAARLSARHRRNGNGTTELPKVTVNGPPKLIEAAMAEDRKFVVLSAAHGWRLCLGAGTDDFLKFALANYAVDRSRSHLTGLSCGAIGSWEYLGEHTNESRRCG